MANQVALKADSNIQAFVPQSLQDIEVFTQMVRQSGLAPKSVSKPEQIKIAIMKGLEVGMKPLQAINSITVINGKPSMYAEAVMALVQGSGQLEDWEEKFTGKKDTDERTAVCRMKRRGMKSYIENEFSVADAKKAKLWGRSGPWTEYSERMLKIRARSYVLRDLFADITAGIWVREEAEDIDIRSVRGREQTPEVSADELLVENNVAEEVEEAILVADDNKQLSEDDVQAIIISFNEAQTTQELQALFAAHQNDIDAMPETATKKGLRNAYKSRLNELKHSTELAENEQEE